MCEEKIKEVMTKFIKEAKRIYGSLIYDVISTISFGVQ